jgi:hypothetical protein
MADALNLVNQGYKAYDYGMAGAQGSSAGLKFANVANKVSAFLSKQWIGDVVCAIPPFNYAMKGLGYVVSVPSEKLAYWWISRSIESLVHSQVKAALASPVADFAWDLLSEVAKATLPVSVNQALESNTGKTILAYGKKSVEEEISFRILTKVMETLDPLIAESGSKAFGNMATSATEVVVKTYIATQAHQLALSKLEEVYPDSKETIETINSYTGWKMTATAVMGMACVYMMPVLYRRMMSGQEKARLREDLVNKLYESSKDPGLSEAALRLILSDIVDILLTSSMIDVHLLRAAFDKIDKK